MMEMMWKFLIGLKKKSHGADMDNCSKIPGYGFQGLSIVIFFPSLQVPKLFSILQQDFELLENQPFCA